MIDADLGSLEWVLSQNDLKLTWSFAFSAAGNDRLDKAPTKAGFFWKRGAQQVHSIIVARDELADVIPALESKGLKVPDEFHEAFQNFQI
ncbi:MAG: hypothetical protein SWQ30_14405 [Thermodesulfobacteriota bacterium]|nr:hypothetical protein [Thermodesulfobacteriota bacterium]